MNNGRFALPATCALVAMTACTTAPTPSDKSATASPERTTRQVAQAIHAAHAAQPRGAHRHAPRAPAPLAARKPSQHEAMQAVTAGGPVMSAPKVVPILFPGNPYEADVRDFFAKLGGSDYWNTAVSEYGVGPITVLPPYVPADAPPTNAGTTDWLTALLASPPSGVPAPDDNTIYAIVFPPGWDAEDGACVRWGADHWYTSMPSGQAVMYTQNPMCPNGYLGMNGRDEATDALSHEIAEAATDPTGTTYNFVNWELSGWASAAEGSAAAEIGDLCEFQPDADYVDPKIGHMVQRMWSNKSQAAGHDPCLPLLPSRPVYFNADAVLTEGTQSYPYGYTKGISIPPGREATVAVRLHADGPMSGWTLAAEEEPNPHLSPDVYKELSFSWDETCGRSGDVRHLTIKRAPAPDGGAPVFLRVAITSTSGTTTNKSWLVVGTE